MPSIRTTATHALACEAEGMRRAGLEEIVGMVGEGKVSKASARAKLFDLYKAKEFIDELDRENQKAWHSASGPTVTDMDRGVILRTIRALLKDAIRQAEAKLVNEQGAQDA